jgi:hypothetical protein
MCFSAGASFGAGAVLLVAGAVAMSKAKTKPQRVFAAIPFIFSAQQLIEGMLWVTLRHPVEGSTQQLFTYLFLVFAWTVWPIWIPFSIRGLEPDPRRKKQLTICFYTGLAVSICVACIFFLYPVKVMPMRNHIHYLFDFPSRVRQLVWVCSIPYFVVTVASPFISSHKRMKWLGMAFLISYLFTLLFYKNYVVSVWCFFAAILSIVVIWIITGVRSHGNTTGSTMY